MPTFTIDQQCLEAQPGATILQAARAAGIEIPTLCHLKGDDAGASCMVCAVKLKHNGQFIPACGSRVVDGMELEHDTPDVHATRRMALELLLSDHLGDCLSPCQRICPAHLGIPAVLKHIRAGEFRLAAAATRHDLALAGILCRICHRPCENGCRRGVHDDAVAIADLVIHVMDTELASPVAAVYDRRAEETNVAAVYDRRAEETNVAVVYDRRCPGNAIGLHADADGHRPDGHRPPLQAPHSLDGHRPPLQACHLLDGHGPPLQATTNTEHRHNHDPLGRVAVIGSGFTGLSAAWFLSLRGYACTVIDENPLPATTIRAAWPELPPGLLEAELRLLERIGVEFRCATRVDATALADLTKSFDAVLLATGPASHVQAAALALATDGSKLAADKHSMMTLMDGVFAAGRAVRPGGQAVVSVADGKAAAVCIHQYLSHQPVLRPAKPFSVFMGKVVETEMQDFLQDASIAGRSDAQAMTCDIDRAIEESKRCVHCNCSKVETCKLRQLAIDYDVNPHRFSSGERLRFQRNIEHPLVCFEAGKCIRCGNCIKVAGSHQDALGLTFIGRGFDVHLGVPFHESLRDGLLEAARAAVAACPTGALTLRE